jgi:hypothetical protein
VSECVPSCWTEAVCTTCDKRKAPRGRSVPLPMAGSLCDPDCSGYLEAPSPPHLWWSETRTCEQCGRRVAEADAIEPGNGMAFCGGDCYRKCVGV